MDAASNDIFCGIMLARVWTMLAWQEIRQRYRRSVLGPFWLTISTAIMILGIGVIYGSIFGSTRSKYLPYIAMSFVIWQLLAALLNEACQAFIVAEGYIKQIKLPLSLHVLRVVWRNLIIFAHNLPIIVAALFVSRPPLSWELLEVPLGVLVLALNGVWAGLLLGMLCARFRDIPQIVASIVQLAFFVTPVMWEASMLKSHRWVLSVNPLYHFMETIRAPLLGSAPSSGSWLVVISITIVGSLITLLVFKRFRARIAYWL